MSFPLYYFLFPAALFALIYVIFVLMDIYHLVAFAEMHFISFFMTFIFLAGIVYLLFWVWALAAGINWNETVSLFKDISFEAPTF